MSNLTKYAGWDEKDVESTDREMQGGAGEFWKPSQGRNVIRVLPALRKWGHSPFVTVNLHFVNTPGGQVTFPCPRKLSASAPCPVCDKARELYNSGRDPDIKLAKDLFPKRRVACNIIDRGDEEKGPQRFGFGKMVWDGMKALREDPDVGGDFTHPISGFDLIINRVGSGRFDTRYTINSGRQRPLSDDEDQMDDWIGGQKPFEKPKLLSGSAIKRLVTGQEEAEDDEDDDRHEETAQDMLDWNDE